MTVSRRQSLLLVLALACGGCLLLLCRPHLQLAIEPSPASLPPPFFNITASSLYDAGFQQGRLAEDRIKAWFATQEMKAAFAYASGNGTQAFAALKRDNSAEFPELVEEMRGISEGAGVPLDHVWVANLLEELENIRRVSPKGKKAGKLCSDIYVVADGGYESGFSIGHNDDWTPDGRRYSYFVSYQPSAGGAAFPSCAGLAYPATLIGWAVTWNAHGMWSSQNTLTPNATRAGGLAAAFVQRRAMCGASNMDEALEALTVPGWSNAGSMNILDLRGKRMSNLEVWEDRHSILEVSATMRNYSHFNEYKHLTAADGRRIDDPADFVDDPRQPFVDSQSPPRSSRDIMTRLSADAVFNKNATVVTVLVHSTGRMEIWCCGEAATEAEPLYSFDLFNFFGLAAGKRSSDPSAGAGSGVGTGADFGARNGGGAVSGAGAEFEASSGAGAGPGFGSGAGSGSGSGTGARSSPVGMLGA